MAGTALMAAAVINADAMMIRMALMVASPVFECDPVISPNSQLT
jgi:hypothetical protein